MVKSIWLRVSAALLMLVVAACSTDQAAEPTPAPTLTLIAATATDTPMPTAPPATAANLPAPDEIGVFTPTATPHVEDTSAPLTGEALVAQDPVAAGFVALARDRVAEEVDLPLARVFLVDVRPAEWTDASLNCPLPDAVYAELVTPGYRIVVRAGQQEFLFHTDVDRLVPCDPANEQLPEVLRVQLEATPEVTPEVTEESTADASDTTRVPTRTPVSNIVG